MGVNEVAAMMLTKGVITRDAKGNKYDDLDLYRMRSSVFEDKDKLVLIVNGEAALVLFYRKQKNYIIVSNILTMHDYYSNITNIVSQQPISGYAASILLNHVEKMAAERKKEIIYEDFADMFVAAVSITEDYMISEGEDLYLHSVMEGYENFCANWRNCV